MRRIYKLLLCTVSFMIFTTAEYRNIYAAPGPDEKMPVAIRTFDGESVVCLPGEDIIMSVPVVFEPEGGVGTGYCISVDDGENFGGYVSMEQESITLFPDDPVSPSGRWKIRFRSAGDEENVSEVYSVVFDTIGPQIVFKDPEIISEPVVKAETIHFDITDETGISRVIARIDDEVVFEKHIAGGTRVREYEAAFTLKDAAGGNRPVAVTVFDLAGNRTELLLEYRADTEDPAISAEGIEDNAHMAQGASLTFFATDDTADVAIDYKIEKVTKEQTLQTEVTGATSPVGIPFEEDGIYTVSASAVDAAGRRSKVITRQFVIDTGAPLINIGGISENSDSRYPVGMTVEVNDNLYEGSKVNIILSRRILGSSEMLKEDTYNLQAYKDIRAINISSDGEYEVFVRATDSAGNTATASKSFRIDATAPDIALFGLAEGEITNTKPVVRFCAGELFFDSTVMTAHLEKRQRDGFIPVRTDNLLMRSKQDHMDIEIADEGEYRLTCMATDRSGNSKSTSMNFTVDHTPPVIAGLDSIDKGYFRSFRLPGRIAELVSDMTKFKADAYVNETKIGDDDVIIEEGKYVLTVFAEDGAGNASEKNVAFMIDRTSPQIVLSGFDRDGNIKKGSLIRVGLSDEADRLLAVTFNDRNIALSGNEAYIAVNEYGNYRLGVRAEDDAGNITDTQVQTSCNMYSPAFSDIIRTEKTISATPDVADDPDLAGVLIGLATTLAGTFGLTWRAHVKS